MRAVLSSLVICFVTAGCGQPSLPGPPGAGEFAFAALGDAPYHWWEENQFTTVIEEMEAADLAFAVHVGDIFWRPCSDAMMERRRAQFAALRHPLIYTPGDNEWADCWEPRVGGYRPRERLDQLRQVYFADPQRSLGARPIPLVSQAAAGDFPEFVENARWWHDGVLFASVHLVGSENFRAPFPGRTPGDDGESVRRTAAAAAWLRAAFVEAVGARAVVIAFHANPEFEARASDGYRQAYDPFLEALEDEVAAFAGPVLVVQGDNHDYIVDHPLRHRATGERLANLTRVQVPGSPLVGWVQVAVTRDPEEPFRFELRTVPRWRIW